MVGAAMATVVAAKGVMDFQHKNIEEFLETRMSLIFD
jgi:hypothetical protein